MISQAGGRNGALSVFVKPGSDAFDARMHPENIKAGRFNHAFKPYSLKQF